jgi:mannose-6-phosphate isomerase
MTLDAHLLRPWRLPPNRVSRFYRGGLLLDRFRAAETPADGDHPEDWVGSATRAWTPPGAPRTDEGLAEAEIDGRRHRIADLLAADPAAVAGPELVEAAGGPTLGVLVKLLDAGIRLPVHAHPTRAFARERLGSFFGKAEAWLITGTRDAGDPDGPGVWLGFRRDVGRDELIGWIEGGDSEAVLAAMHRRPVHPGQTWFVPPGVPHAIGAGVFIVEVQEPSDFSIVAETRDFPIDASDAHLHLGWNVTIDAFDRSGRDDAWVDALRHDGIREATHGGAWRREPLTDAAADPFFRADRLTVSGWARPDLGPPGFLVGIVVAGEGSVRAGSGGLAVGHGDTLAVPAAVVGDVEIESAGGLELILCRPPAVEDLAEGER